MSDAAPPPAAPSTPAPQRRSRIVLYVLTVLITAAATYGIMLLWQNISERKQEGRQQVFKVVDIALTEEDPSVWGKNFPRQYDGYQRTAENSLRHAGSEAEPSPQKR